VDLEYQKELHDLHNEYPLAAERMKINKVEKHIPNLSNKAEYVVNYRALKCYEKHGIEVTKIYPGIKYRESTWMGHYIDVFKKERHV
jgi:hypothetical protein